MEKYPFRFKGPKIGDIVWWVCDDWETGKPIPTVIESKIVYIEDSFTFAERDLSDPTQTEENWCIFYAIKDWPNGNLTFGNDLFLTKDEAELYLKTKR